MLTVPKKTKKTLIVLKQLSYYNCLGNFLAQASAAAQMELAPDSLAADGKDAVDSRAEGKASNTARHFPRVTHVCCIVLKSRLKSRAFLSKGKKNISTPVIKTNNVVLKRIRHV